MGPRFALRWTIIGLVCFAPLLIGGILLTDFSSRQPLPQQPFPINALAAAAEMPLNANGGGTQVISGTTLTLRIQPYPPTVSVSSTLTLFAVGPDGKPAQFASPLLTVRGPEFDARRGREYAFEQRPDGVYVTTGDYFTSPGAWHLRVDVNVGDDVPAVMLVTVNAR